MLNDREIDVIAEEHRELDEDNECPLLLPDGKGEECLREFARMVEFQVRKEYASLVKAAQHFVWKCNVRKAHSVESYRQFKEALILAHVPVTSQCGYEDCPECGQQLDGLTTDGDVCQDCRAGAIYCHHCGWDGGNHAASES